MKTTKIVNDASNDIIKYKYFDDRFRKYLVDKKVSKKYWPLIIACISKTIHDKSKHLIHYLVVDNINEVVNNVKNFIYLLETLTLNGYNSDEIHYMIIYLDVSLDKLFSIYAKMLSSNEKIVQISSGTVLGLIGQKSPEIIFKEVKKNLENNDNDKKKSLLSALFISSYKPNRPLTFNPPKFILEFVITCLGSQDKEISYKSLGTCLRLFDFDPTFFYEYLINYINYSNDSKISFLHTIYYTSLTNPDYELKLLIESSKTNSPQIISKVIYVFSNKLQDEKINKKKLQRKIFHLFKKWHKHQDIQNLSKNERILENTVKVDISFAFDFLLKWIVEENDDIVKHKFFYPELIYNAFKNTEGHLISFLEKLSLHNKRFDALIDGIFKEMIFDLRLKFDSMYLIYNATTTRDLKIYFKTQEISESVNKLYANTLDEVPARISNALKIIKEHPLRLSDTNYKLVENKKKDLNTRLKFFTCKHLLISRCLDLLVRLSKERGLKP